MNVLLIKERLNFCVTSCEYFVLGKSFTPQKEYDVCLVCNCPTYKMAKRNTCPKKKWTEINKQHGLV